MTPTEMTSLVREYFPDAQRIGDSVVQFTRRDGSRPFAICYLDCGHAIPRTLSDLRSYQDRIIGQHYFEGAKSLQWNNYLYFIASDDLLSSAESMHIRGLLEQDRTYARKFLVAERELGGIFRPRVVAPEQTTRPSVLTIWNSSLSEAGLGRAIWGDLDMPKRMSIIETGNVQKTTAPSPSTQAAALPGRQLNRLSLIHYRPYPLERHFDFGTVNLITGPNAAGKTSLLEAIELLYCGRNKRSPSDKPDYEFRATFADDETELADDGRPIRLFRQRNLSWYGQAEVQTNNLYSSFARFNFLDTDAAVRLADEATKLDDELSKLLIGPDAAKTWDNIVRVNEHAKARLKNLREEERAIQRQVTELENLLSSLTEGASSDPIRNTLVDTLREQGWKVPTAESAEELVAQLVGPLSALLAIARQAAALPLPATPSRTVLERFARSMDASRQKIAADIDYLAGLEREINISVSEIERADAASLVLQRATRYAAAGIPARLVHLNRLRQAMASVLDRLGGIDQAAIRAAAAQNPEVGASQNLARASVTRSQIGASLERAQKDYSQLQSTRERSANLVEELKITALMLLGETRNETECPLCHTQFKAGDLIAHINSEFSASISKEEERVLTRVREAEEAGESAALDEVAARSFVIFANRAGLPVDAALAKIAAAIEADNADLSQYSDSIKSIQQDLEQMDEQGLPSSEVEPTRVELVKLRFPLSDWTQGSIIQVSRAIASFRQNQHNNLQACAQKAEEHKAQIGAVLKERIETIEQAKVSLAALEQNSASAASLASKLAEIGDTFTIPKTKPLGEVAVEAEAVRQLASELEAAIQRERDNNIIQTQTANRKAALTEALGKLLPRIRQLSGCVNVLQRLQREHSLHAAMQEAISHNRLAIESIFGQIHAPQEFAGLGDEVTTLRRLDGTLAKLSDISTGQRAALGLSMFLAQNMKLTHAPPIILIDDPIAHVDDLNCLSFLDYLREIALSKRRQIFFATANDKLAAMFERKFDFLGEAFRKIELHRESVPQYSS
ncbi:exonuclease SbcC [Bradyrhizobium sp. USDA 3686]|uniref:AAA family ATPase n=1 Tax=Bradyrhizobium TaxID=374 RepID=UPI0019583A31|nr:AAA family ATPase [Bradyrhizobium canariense]MBM7485178.1 energy-coupling factor transporter ATP-binding protein EcfA2 [Bradyrhizobium canariense]UFW73731.1 AAA family ATPase [Bradyrhizobium canariense]